MYSISLSDLVEVEHWQQTGKSLRSNGKKHRFSSQFSLKPIHWLATESPPLYYAEVWSLRRSSCEWVSRGERSHWFQGRVGAPALPAQIFSELDGFRIQIKVLIWTCWFYFGIKHDWIRTENWAPWKYGMIITDVTDPIFSISLESVRPNVF